MKVTVKFGRGIISGRLLHFGDRQLAWYEGASPRRTRFVRGIELRLAFGRLYPFLSDRYLRGEPLPRVVIELSDGRRRIVISDVMVWRIGVTGRHYSVFLGNQKIRTLIRERDAKGNRWVV